MKAYNEVLCTKTYEKKPGLGKCCWGERRLEGVAREYNMHLQPEQEVSDK